MSTPITYISLASSEIVCLEDLAVRAAAIATILHSLEVRGEDSAAWLRLANEVHHKRVAILHEGEERVK